jgi:hypothetical protein
MPLKIIKLAIASENKVFTSPTVTRLFHITPELIPELTTHKIGTAGFMDDSGETVDSLPSLNLDNSYFNVYINGVLQMDENFSYTAGEDEIGFLMISVTEGSEITQGTPIILEVVNFNPVITTTYEK